MRKSNSLLILLLFMGGMNIRLSAQDEATFNTYKFAGVEYSVPADWENDPFGSYKPEEWNEYGSAVCECTGIIHIDYETDLHLVFYPSLVVDLDSKRHSMIWDYIYEPVSEKEPIQVGKIEFEREVSTFENSEKYEVWRYKCQVGKYGYLLYFFAPPQSMESNSETIDAIIQSFKKSNALKLRIK